MKDITAAECYRLHVISNLAHSDYVKKTPEFSSAVLPPLLDDTIVPADYYMSALRDKQLSAIQIITFT